MWKWSPVEEETNEMWQACPIITKLSKTKTRSTYAKDCRFTHPDRFNFISWRKEVARSKLCHTLQTSGTSFCLLVSFESLQPSWCYLPFFQKYFQFSEVMPFTVPDLDKIPIRYWVHSRLVDTLLPAESEQPKKAETLEMEGSCYSIKAGGSRLSRLSPWFKRTSHQKFSATRRSSPVGISMISYYTLKWFNKSMI